MGRKSLAQRTVTSVTWSVATSLVTTIVLFLRSTLLARMLPVEVFGVYAGATALVGLTSVFAAFGMAGAFLHRSEETADEEEAAAIYFTIKCLLILIWAAILGVGAWLFASGESRTALLMLTFTTAGLHLTHVPRHIMTRRVEHRRIATIQLVNAFLGTIVALGLARAGQTLWALLAVDLLLMVATIFAWYVYRPVWRPRFAWDRQKVRYFLRFGSKNFTATLLLNALNRVDDLWTQYFLSTYSLGLYSRAYKFATYPGIILANPVHMVAAGTYAELKENRRGLSRAFFRINAIMIRSGFLLAGLIGLIAPEFILLALGDKWLPMLGAFRYMLLFTLFDPVKRTIGGLFVAVGQPGELARVRFFQLIVLLVGLFTLGFWLDITGVAIAVDLMLLAGIVVLLFRVRAYVDYSVVQLMAAPGVALAVAIAGTYLALGWLPADASPWLTGSSKTAVFSLLYGVLLAALEWREILSILGGLQRMFRAGET